MKISPTSLAIEYLLMLVRLLALNLTLLLLTLTSPLWFLYERHTTLLNPHASPHAPPASAPRCVLITGASSGIGAALAASYASTPDVLLCLVGRSKERLEAVKAACEGKGARVMAVVADVTDRDRMEEIVNELEDERGIDLVVASAGVARGEKDKAKTLASIGMARETININVMGVLNTITPAMELMANKRHGQIAVMSSAASFIGGFPTFSSYPGSKAALRNLVDGLRPVLALRGVRLNLVCPGFIETEMIAGMKGLPMVMGVGECVEKIREGLEMNQGTIAFPYPVYLVTFLLGAFPPEAKFALNSLLIRVYGNPGFFLRNAA